jgi:hypothetical protein
MVIIRADFRSRSSRTTLLREARSGESRRCALRRTRSAFAEYVVRVEGSCRCLASQNRVVERSVRSGFESGAPGQRSRRECRTRARAHAPCDRPRTRAALESSFGCGARGSFARHGPARDGLRGRSECVVTYEDVSLLFRTERRVTAERQRVEVGRTASRFRDLVQKTAKTCSGISCLVAIGNRG